ncbi:NADP-dependent oxidoreductase [Effusibacillus lacus]|uniref:NADPH:quinone reductase n=1 Tax=Effusibacillus lacus TaxID=1348429 RepID=A0A292YTE7_9BACL|nr:NADP-dependent oxidoreductase [Effusibacillus lacus]TCS75853.1 NADPH:quinone reductase-like Zn-dependent oxidoreductase [Effusibacillus lacus]GAX91755.1 NADPH:quinone reductase [Effusibacillus lacus]
MKAVIIENYGGRDQLKLVDTPVPEIRERDVLVEVHSASVNPVDWKVREGRLKARITYEFPLILGWDLAGVIKQVGSHVTKFRVGDEVFSRPDISRNGTYAEYTVVEENLLAIKPSNLTFEEAASVPLAGLTAWEALVEISQLKTGDKVLIHAGAGGVGGYAIQLAKSLGAYVATTVSGRNVKFVKELGADEVIDYGLQDFSKVLHDFDVVFDTVGGEVQTKSFEVLKENGILVSIVSPPNQEVALQKKVRPEYFFLQPDGEKLAKLANLFETGDMKPIVGSVFSLSEVAKAHELSESGHAQGKIVIKIK